ncbi:amidase [Actinokineospora diospyrosa]|uniref:Amidase n=1 Tax=Actinokineospora diospyrosa TaxID=103728 RepID=A0ABT1I5K5_9PSEU|nr:amidase [Actinokineospora diospyrosa]MCP2267861.1 Amidase [Actinokineospora diospyrosa]
MIADYVATAAVEIARMVNHGQVTAVEIARMALARLDQVDGWANAFRTVEREGAVVAARQVDRLVASGAVLPLAGVPIGVKAKTGRAAFVRAGCVVLGTTSVPGPGTPWRTWGRNDRGLTLNPWHSERSPGGSSAGSAVAVATGVVPIATGGDGAGSVRIPAAWCGVIGVKVTSGDVVAPGVLAAWPQDAKAAAEVLLGRELDPRAAAGVWSGDLGFATTDPEQAAVARESIRVPLEDIAVDLVDPQEAWFRHRAGEGVDVSENLRRLAAIFERVDLILTPTTPNPPHGHDGPGATMSTALTWLFNLTGHPAASIPAGFTEDGCPVGLQVIARRGREEDLLAPIRPQWTQAPIRPPASPPPR